MAATARPWHPLLPAFLHWEPSPSNLCTELIKKANNTATYSPSLCSSFLAGISLGAHEHQSHPAICYPKPSCMHFSCLPESHCPSPPVSFLIANSSFSWICLLLRVSCTDSSHSKVNAFSAAWGLPTPL